MHRFAFYNDVPLSLNAKLKNILRRIFYVKNFHNFENGRGKSRESKLENFYILGAYMFQEIQRMANILPINLPHTCANVVRIDSFLLPAGTIVLPQVRAQEKNSKM